MTIRQGRWLLAGLFGLAMGMSTGCQTYVMSTGQTLPTGYYLDHPPQYFPPSPPYPLPRELKSQTDAMAAYQKSLLQAGN